MKPRFGDLRNAIHRRRALPEHWDRIPGAVDYVREHLNRGRLDVKVAVRCHEIDGRIVRVELIPEYMGVQLARFAIRLDPQQMAMYVDGYLKWLSDETGATMENIHKTIKGHGIPFVEHPQYPLIKFIQDQTENPWKDS